MAHAAKALLIAIMSALACATSSIADTATDVELYAAYCMGVHAFEKEYFQDKHLAEAERAAGCGALKPHLCDDAPLHQSDLGQP